MGATDNQGLATTESNNACLQQVEPDVQKVLRAVLPLERYQALQSRPVRPPEAPFDVAQHARRQV